MQQQGFDDLEALSVKNVAALLSVSRPTVEKWIKDGHLPSLELGGCRRVLRTDLQAFLEQRRRYGLGSLRRPAACQDGQSTPGFIEGLDDDVVF
jgi:excisionase family DNA binding protein